MRWRLVLERCVGGYWIPAYAGMTTLRGTWEGETQPAVAKSQNVTQG
jgi:hypothetical protein